MTKTMEHIIQDSRSQDQNMSQWLPNLNANFDDTDLIVVHFLSNLTADTHKNVTVHRKMQIECTIYLAKFPEHITKRYAMPT